MTTMTASWVGSPTLCRESGATYRQVTYWSAAGFLHSISGPEPGSGYRHRFPPVEIDVARALRVLVPLRRHGSVVTDEQIHGCAAHIRMGERGHFRLAHGVWLDLDAICGAS